MELDCVYCWDSPTSNIQKQLISINLKLIRFSHQVSFLSLLKRNKKRLMLTKKERMPSKEKRNNLSRLRKIIKLWFRKWRLMNKQLQKPLQKRWKKKQDKNQLIKLMNIMNRCWKSLLRTHLFKIKMKTYFCSSIRWIKIKLRKLKCWIHLLMKLQQVNIYKNISKNNHLWR